MTVMPPPPFRRPHGSGPERRNRPPPASRSGDQNNRELPSLPDNPRQRGVVDKRDIFYPRVMDRIELWCCRGGGHDVPPFGFSPSR